MRDYAIVSDGAPVLTSSIEEGSLIAVIHPNQSRSRDGDLLFPSRLFIVVHSEMRGRLVADEIGWLAARYVLGAERLSAMGERVMQITHTLYGSAA